MSDWIYRWWVGLVERGKIKCAAICVGLCSCIAALLILRRVGILSVRFIFVYCRLCVSTLVPNFRISANRYFSRGLPKRDKLWTAVWVVVLLVINALDNLHHIGFDPHGALAKNAMLVHCLAI